MGSAIVVISRSEFRLCCGGRPRCIPRFAQGFSRVSWIQTDSIFWKIKNKDIHTIHVWRTYKRIRGDVCEMATEIFPSVRPAQIERSNMQKDSRPAICHRFTRWSISGMRTDMKNDTSYSSLSTCAHGESARMPGPWGCAEHMLTVKPAKAGAEFRVHSHQEGTYGVYWSMSQPRQHTSRTEIPYTLCSIFKASGQCSTLVWCAAHNAHLSVYIFNTGKCKEPIWPCRHIGYNVSLIRSWIWKRLDLVGSSCTAVESEIWPTVSLSFQVRAFLFPQLTSAVDLLSKSQYDALPLLCSL